MFIFILQIRHMLDDHAELYLFTVFSALVWALWILKVALSRRYKPWTEEHHETTSVIVPVVDEPLDLFRDVLTRVTEQHPDEVIVVINGKRNPDLEAVCEEFAPLVQWVHTPIPGKRNAVKIGTEMSKYDITVLLDSDTVWTPGTLSELIKPFKDANVGGVTTRQRILEPSRSWITRWADWLENSRSLYSMPAQSVLGQVGCLPGRTIAFRRHILMEVMDDFMTQRFMGVFLEVSDDRTLTNLTLKQGYRTVYQHTSLVYTDAPLQIKKLFKQQLRWARGSQYNTLRMLPWMLGHAPVLSIFFLADIILPFLLVGTIAGWVYRAASGTGVNLYEAMLETYGAQAGWFWVIALMVVSSVLSMAIRQIRHLQEVPSDFFRLPIFIIVSTFFLMPVRLLGFLRMAHASGWGTRAGAYAGGDPGQGGVEPEGGVATLEAELDLMSRPAPVDVVDRDGGLPTQRDHATDPQHGTPVPAGVAAHAAHAEQAAYGSTPAWHTTAAGGVPAGAVETAPVAEATRRQARAAAPAPTPKKRLNPLAGIPYVIAAVIFALEALLYV
ncbi:glycosyltransferase family 2 protein [Cellulomonas triticagri]|uniref:Glycosyltransferase n=1 Tax=Cellulomonas triticagri TaxID=2483352 RepID=A0A3M2JLI4_9CELL|nr:glycosyltransferase family 2 protein [Cellulomonas triticagri]RMI14004.1 glycosyltransferase [Cellulomonas triticagri]